ncbi:ABC transporter ATP-binding protein [Nonomuraea sp. NPDC050540]|uniref:ABC transporter ATP-binding protein n=1 Tax=Nonomuraea sp. NPDC050540 TaxID=3364367 RepID=UPI003787761C
MALWRLLARYLRPRRRAVAAVVFLQVAQTAALLYLPTLNAVIIDDGVFTGDTGLILRLGAVMAGVSLVQGGATLAAVHLSARTAMGVGRDLREAVYLHVQRLSTQEVGALGVPSLITRTTNDVQQIQTLALSLLTVIVAAPVMAVGGIVMAVLQDVALSWLLVALALVLGAVTAVLVGRMRPLSRAVQERVDAVNRVLREQIAGIRVTRAFVRQDAERARFGRANEELTDVSTRLGYTSAALMPLVVNLVNVCGVFVIWAGARRVGDAGLGVGELTAFLTYLAMIQTAVLTAAFVIMNLPRAEVCAVRVAEVLDTEPGLAPPANPVGRMRAPGRVELRGVRFRYPGAEDDVLHGVDLVARPGTTTAIVGSTGSGKSTLLSLIRRLSDPTQGTVLFGGEDATTLDPGLLARSASLVEQRPHLFSGTVATNLRHGRPRATDDELWHALGIAQARDFVPALDTPVAQGGANLSGGQRQRLSLARALVRRAPVYLLDDPFSALDHTTESRVRQALAAETADATVIVVAQRVRAILDADHIVVLDEGRVAGAGTHDELVRDSPVYREIVRSQLGEELVG